MPNKMKLKTKNYNNEWISGHLPAMSSAQPKQTEARDDREGFTLIEVMLVVVIAISVFIPMYSFYATTIKFDTETRYEIIASNLVQEGIELCRNERDNKILIDENIAGGFDCPSGINDNIFNNFSRSCSVSEIKADEIYKVTCTVKWNSFASAEGILEREVKAESILTDWSK